MLGLLGGGALNGMMDEDPRRQGLLSAALAGLAASGPSTKPVSFGQTLGQAGMQGMQSMRDAEQFGMARDMKNLQMEQMRFQQQKAQQEMQQREQIQSLIPMFSKDPAAMLMAQTGDFKGAVERLYPKAEYELKETRTPDGKTQYSYIPKNPMAGQVMPSGAAPAVKRQLVNVPVDGQPGVTRQVWVAEGESDGVGVGGMKFPEILNPRVREAKKEVAAAGASRNNTTVVSNQEKEESKVVGKAFGEQYADIQKAGINAQSTINRVERLNALLQNVQTGKLTPFGTEVAKTAASLGINIDSNLGNKEAAASLANEMALQLRNPAGGAGMPGAMSDADREFLKSMTPGLSTTPEGRKMMTETTIKIAKRDQEVAKLARDYRKKNGSLDEGFYDVLSAYSNANPLFAAPGGAQPATPAGWAIRKVP